MMNCVVWTVLSLAGIAYALASPTRCPVMTANSHDDVAIVSDPIGRPTKSLTNFFFEGGPSGRMLTHFIVDFDGAIVATENNSHVSVIVHLDGNSRSVQMIRDVTLILPDVSEKDSGDYRLTSVQDTLNCWTIYVLGKGKYAKGHNLIEEGHIMNVTDFPHLSEKIAQRMNATTSWQIGDDLFNQHNGFSLTVPRSMNNEHLIYTILGKNEIATSVDYILNVAYTGPIVFEPNKSRYGLSENGTVRCIADCNPACKVRWELNGNHVADTNAPDTSVLELGTRPGFYECLATNTATGQELRRTIAVYNQGCEHQNHSIIMATSHDNIALVSDAYNLTRSVNSFFIKSTGRYQTVAFIIVLESTGLKVSSHAPNVSVDAVLEGRRHIPNITATLTDVDEADSGVYKLTMIDGKNANVLKCWTLYVLGNKGDDIPRNGYVEEGSILNVAEFPHLSDDVIQRMNASTSWQLDGERLYRHPDDHVTITRGMDNMPLTYIIEGPSNGVVSVDYTLNVSYTGPVVLEPNRTRYSLTENTTVRCVADCHPVCNVTWKRGKSVVSESDILKPESRSLPGEYNCHVTNIASRTHVIGSISVSLEPNQTAYVLTPGESIPDIRCVAECNTPCNTTWKKQEVLVSDTDVLSVASIPIFKGGVYTCIVQDMATKARNEKHVFVYFEEEITVSLEPTRTMYVLRPDETIPSIRCKASCTSHCNVSWTMEGVLVSDTDMLSAASLPGDRSGMYTCRVQDKLTNAQRAIHIFIYFEEKEKYRIVIYALAGLLAMFALAKVALLIRAFRQGDCQWLRPAFKLRKQKKGTLDIGMYNHTMDTDVDTERKSDDQPEIQRDIAVDNVYDSINNGTNSTMVCDGDNK